MDSSTKLQHKFYLQHESNGSWVTLAAREDFRDMAKRKQYYEEAHPHHTFRIVTKGGVFDARA